MLAFGDGDSLVTYYSVKLVKFKLQKRIKIILKAEQNSRESCNVSDNINLKLLNLIKTKL